MVWFIKKSFQQNKQSSISWKEAEKDISEPVIRIIKAMEERPDTFKVRLIHASITDGGFAKYSYLFTDSITDLKATYVKCLSMLSKEEELFIPLYITSDEREALIEAGKKLIEYKRERISEVNKARGLRRRNKWTDVYSRVD